MSCCADRSRGERRALCRGRRGFPHPLPGRRGSPCSIRFLAAAAHWWTRRPMSARPGRRSGSAMRLVTAGRYAAPGWYRLPTHPVVLEDTLRAARHFQFAFGSSALTNKGQQPCCPTQSTASAAPVLHQRRTGAAFRLPLCVWWSRPAAGRNSPVVVVPGQREGLAVRPLLVRVPPTRKRHLPVVVSVFFVSFSYLSLSLCFFSCPHSNCFFSLAARCVSRCRTRSPKFLSRRDTTSATRSPMRYKRPKKSTGTPRRLSTIRCRPFVDLCLTTTSTSIRYR